MTPTTIRSRIVLYAWWTPPVAAPAEAGPVEQAATKQVSVAAVQATIAR